jgi:hypothetical protein
MFGRGVKGDVVVLILATISFQTGVVIVIMAEKLIMAVPIPIKVMTGVPVGAVLVDSIVLVHGRSKRRR